MTTREQARHADPPADLLALAEAARRSGLSARTLARQAGKGTLRARKLGRTWVTTAAWLEAYLPPRRGRSATPGERSRPRAATFVERGYAYAAGRGGRRAAGTSPGP